MKIDCWITLATLVSCLMTGRLISQIPPILEGPGTPATAPSTKYRGHLLEFNDPRSRDFLWDERTAAYKRAFAMIRKEARELGRWFEPKNPKIRDLLDQIMSHTGAMESALVRRSPYWAPWTISLKTEQFLQQLSDIAYALKDINTKLKPTLDHAKRDPGGSTYGLYASAAAGLSAGSQTGPERRNIFRFIEDLSQDLQVKNNLDWLDVKVYTMHGTRPIAGYKIGCYWILSSDIFEMLGKQTTHLKGTLRGYSTPTKPTSLPAGVYMMFGTPKGRYTNVRTKAKRVEVKCPTMSRARESVTSDFYYTLEVE